jgi:outer membrane protein assembly factor BamB
MSLRRFLVVAMGLASLPLAAADWPQWRGLNRDGKVEGFTAPTAWPTELTKKWDVEVGDGCATPALVGERLYVHAREGGDEVLRCLDAATGKEIWRDKHTTQGSTDPGRFVGPRSSPAVAEGKVVTLGARGMLICCDAESGKRLWSKDEIRGWPQFFVSSSPIIVDGMAIAQVGGQQNGAVVAYDLNTGEQKWKWALAGVAPSYGSPAVMTASGTKLIIAQVSDGLVALEAASGKLVWEVVNEGGSRYKAATPIVDGDTLIYLDGPAKAVKLTKEGDKFVAKTLWTVPENAVQFNTPVLREGLLVGLSGRHDLFCINTETKKTAWTSPATRIGGAGAPPDRGNQGDGNQGSKGKGRGRGFGRGAADAGYGSVVDAGSVFMALTPSSNLVVFEPTDKEFKQLASYKVSDTPIYAYPVVSGNRIYVKDSDSVTLWTIE